MCVQFKRRTGRNGAVRGSTDGVMRAAFRCSGARLRGLRGGPRFREGKLYRKVGPTIERLAYRLGPWELLAARFVYGTKAASMLFWGLHGLRVTRFLLIDVIGCTIGALVFTGLGYVVSGSAIALLGKVKRVELWLLGVLLVGAVIVFIIHRTARHELHLDESEVPGE